jgi:hypothetical protein
VIESSASIIRLAPWLGRNAPSTTLIVVLSMTLKSSATSCMGPSAVSVPLAATSTKSAPNADSIPLSMPRSAENSGSRE